MSTTRRTRVMVDKTGVTRQLRLLIDEAGGQAEFIRKVWGRNTIGDHKGKVSKWYRGERGVSVRELKCIAEKMGTSADYILWGDKAKKSPWLAPHWIHAARRRLASEAVHAILLQWLEEDTGSFTKIFDIVEPLFMRELRKRVKLRKDA